MFWGATPNNNLEAARLYGLGGQWDKAATLYAKSGYPGRAGEAYEKTGEFLKAAESTSAISWRTSRTPRPTRRPRPHPTRRARSTRAGFTRRRATQTRARDLQKGSYFKEAAEACLRTASTRKAAELFMRAEDPGRAADAYEKGGDAVQAANLRGEVAFKAGKAAEAAGFFLHGRDYLRSAELYESVACWRRRREPTSRRTATRRRETSTFAPDSRRRRRPATSAATTRDGGEAVRRGGHTAKAIELFDRAGFTFKSGESAAKVGDHERAISLLQRVAAGDENYLAAAEILADVFIKTHRPALALERLQKVIAGQPISPRTPGPVLLAGRGGGGLGANGRGPGALQEVQAEDLQFRDVPRRVARLQAGAALPPPSADAGSGPIDRIGKYTLGPKIGQGAMGEVFRAHDPCSTATSPSR